MTDSPIDPEPTWRDARFHAIDDSVANLLWQLLLAVGAMFFAFTASRFVAGAVAHLAWVLGVHGRGQPAHGVRLRGDLPHLGPAHPLGDQRATSGDRRQRATSAQRGRATSVRESGAKRLGDGRGRGRSARCDEPGLHRDRSPASRTAPCRFEPGSPPSSRSLWLRGWAGVWRGNTMGVPCRAARPDAALRLERCLVGMSSAGGARFRPVRRVRPGDGPRHADGRDPCDRRTSTIR